MDDFGKTFKQGLGDAGRAVSADVITGLAKGAVDMANEGMEQISGTSGQQTAGQQQADSRNDYAYTEKLKQKEAERRQALARVQGELEEYRQRQLRQRSAMVQAEEQQKQEVKLQMEQSERERKKQEIIAQASKSGGTGEVLRQIN